MYLHHHQNYCKSLEATVLDHCSSHCYFLLKSRLQFKEKNKQTILRYQKYNENSKILLQCKDFEKNFCNAMTSTNLKNNKKLIFSIEITQNPKKILK